MISSLSTLLCSVQQKIKNDFSDIHSLTTLSTTVLDAPSWRLRQPRHLKTPGYYDANTHTIYLNESIIGGLAPATVATIYYHELLHAISYHQVVKQRTTRVFQSGLRLERYGFTGVRQVDHGRLNEGVVQYFSNEFTDNVELAYNNEVMAVSIAVTYLGRTPFLNALVHGNIAGLEEVFNTCFGDRSFARFSAALDARKYDEAYALISVPVVSIATLSIHNNRQLGLLPVSL